jgi:hypothetical protein
MGLRTQLKNKLKETLQNIKSLSFLIHEESKYPGRPQPHMAARNPMWGGEDSAPAEQEASKAAKEAAASEQPVDTRDASGEEFWFLKYDDNEGWDETNPGEKP